MAKDEISPTLFEKYDAYMAFKTKMMKTLKRLKTAALILIIMALGYFVAEMADMIDASEFSLTVRLALNTKYGTLNEDDSLYKSTMMVKPLITMVSVCLWLMFSVMAVLVSYSVKVASI